MELNLAGGDCQYLPQYLPHPWVWWQIVLPSPCQIQSRITHDPTLQCHSTLPCPTPIPPLLFSSLVLLYSLSSSLLLCSSSTLLSPSLVLLSCPLLLLSCPPLLSPSPLLASCLA